MVTKSVQSVVKHLHVICVMDVINRLKIHVDVLIAPVILTQVVG